MFGFIASKMWCQACGTPTQYIVWACTPKDTRILWRELLYAEYLSPAGRFCVHRTYVLPTAPHMDEAQRARSCDDTQLWAR